MNLSAQDRIAILLGGAIMEKELQADEISRLRQEIEAEKRATQPQQPNTEG